MVRLIITIIFTLLSVISFNLPFMAVFITGNWWYIFLFSTSWLPAIVFLVLAKAIVEN